MCELRVMAWSVFARFSEARVRRTVFSLDKELHRRRLLVQWTGKLALNSNNPINAICAFSEN